MIWNAFIYFFFIYLTKISKKLLLKEKNYKMKIFLLLSIIILTIFVVIKKIFYSAKRNLFKDQATWSGKHIKIKYNKSKKTPEFKTTENYLKIIADESKFYLEAQSKHEEEWNEVN